ncbi:3-coathanger stack domain-containing protein [uncultured Arcticibacterium sp.]|uniref:3-coathanger stack domain-containing protein n=1 Tax=uncultured Arcticibacterium sp. TaxID=2173042 RepID=UPI0030FB4AAF
MTLSKLAVIILFLITFHSYATLPSATLTAPSGVSFSAGNGIELEVNLSGTFPMSFVLNGKEYRDVNQPTFTLFLAINENKWMKIDSAWNTSGTSYPQDSIYMYYEKYGPNILKSTVLLGSGNDQGISYLKDSSNNGYLIASVDSKDMDFAYRGNSAVNSIIIRKTNEANALIWETSIVRGTEFRNASKAILTSENNILIIGSLRIGEYGFGGDDIWLTKIDQNGNVLWEKNFGGLQHEYGIDCIETKNGNYVLVGNSLSNNGDAIGNHGQQDAFILMTDSNGNKKWSKQIGGSSSDSFHAVEEDDSGYLYAVGQTSSSNGDITGNFGFSDCLLSKIDSLGSSIWNKNYGSGSHEYFRSICLSDNGNLGILGSCSSVGFPSDKNNSLYNTAFFEIDTSGLIKYEKLFESNNITNPKGILAETNNEYIIAYDYQNSSTNNTKSIRLHKLYSDRTSNWTSGINNPINEHIANITKTGSGFSITGYQINYAYSNGYSVFSYEFSECPTFHAELSAPASIIKYDSLNLKLITNSLYPARIQLNTNDWFTFENENSEWPISPEFEFDAVYNIVYGFNQCSTIKQPFNHLSIEVNPCPESRTLNTSIASNPRLYQATDYISIQETQSEKLELEAGKSISINPGFETNSTNPFRAEIKNCIE